VLDNQQQVVLLDTKTRKMLEKLADRNVAPLQATLLQAAEQPPKGGKMKPPEAASARQGVSSALG
jgi:hypothetical protein